MLVTPALELREADLSEPAQYVGGTGPAAVSAHRGHLSDHTRQCVQACLYARLRVAPNVTGDLERLKAGTTRGLIYALAQVLGAQAYKPADALQGSG